MERVAGAGSRGGPAPTVRLPSPGAPQAEVCAKRQCNVGLLAYSPLAGGSLTGKYIRGGAGVEKARLNLFQGECLESACL